jgi:hypothetical protein
VGDRSGSFEGGDCSIGSKPPAIEKAMKPLTTEGVGETRWTDLNPSPNLPVVDATAVCPGISPGFPLRFNSIIKYRS